MAVVVNDKRTHGISGLRFSVFIQLFLVCKKVSMSQGLSQPFFVGSNQSLLVPVVLRKICPLYRGLF